MIKLQVALMDATTATPGLRSVSWLCRKLGFSTWRSRWLLAEAGQTSGRYGHQERQVIQMGQCIERDGFLSRAVSAALPGTQNAKCIEAIG